MVERVDVDDSEPVRHLWRPDEAETFCGLRDSVLATYDADRTSCWRCCDALAQLEDDEADFEALRRTGIRWHLSPSIVAGNRCGASGPGLPVESWLAMADEQRCAQCAAWLSAGEVEA